MLKLRIHYQMFDHSHLGFLRAQNLDQFYTYMYVKNIENVAGNRHIKVHIYLLTTSTILVMKSWI